MYFPQPPHQGPFLTVGIGSYTFDPGSTHFGVNLGLGVQGRVAPDWSLEGRFTFGGITDNAPTSRYKTLQLGLRYVF